MSICLSSLLKTARSGLIAGTLFLSHNALASSVDVSLSNEMFQIEWQEDLGSNISGGISWLHADTEEKRRKLKTDIVSGDVFLNGQEGMLDFKMGAKVYYMNGEKVEAHGLLLGGNIAINLSKKLYADVEAFYSPNILNGGDFEKYIDAQISAGFKPSNNSKIYLGYKHTEASQGKFDYDPYQGIIFGFGANF